MKNPRRFKAFSLIELLISIIVLGIIMSTIPVFLNTFTSSAKVTSRESVFFNQFSLLSLINTKYFDENNTVGENFYKDLNATGGDDELFVKKFPNGDLNREGKEDIDNNIFRSGSKYTVSKIGPDSGETSVSDYDDIDDFNGYTEHINVGVEGGYDIKVKVSYIDDNTVYSDKNLTITLNYSTPKNLTNIKLITVYTTFSDGSVEKLEYPTCNIGASKLYSLEEIRR
jgi:prepilin-type N-terminal cleavage/methylation domain-containing protein